MDVQPSSNHEGGCMQCQPDENGRMPSDRIYKFRLGIFVARLCLEHIDDLRVGIERVVQEAYRQ